MIILIVLVCLAAAVALFFFVFSLYVFCRINNKRYDGNRHVKYFKASDFPGIEAESIAFASDRGQTLRGYLYHECKTVFPKALLIFAHGYGAGHQAYTTEIAAMANAGYWVLAFDATGCVASDGKCMRGFDQGVIDLRYAIRYADGAPRFSGLKKILVGHSWGAFCALNAVSEESICGAVAVCGFISGAKVLAQNTVGKKLPCLTFIAEGYLRFFNRLRFGKAANQNSLKTVRKSGKPIYLIYGSEDKTVVFAKNGAVFAREFENSENVRCKVCEGKGHNPYLTAEAERAMNETFSSIAAQKKTDPALALLMYERIDYTKITQEDPVIMRSIIEFCDCLAQN